MFNLKLHRRIVSFTVFVLAAACIIAVLAALINLYRPPSGAVVMVHEVSIAKNGSPLGTGTVPVTAGISGQTTSGTGLYRFRFLCHGPLQSFYSPVLVIPFVTGNSCSVRFNGNQLGKFGDRVTGNTSVWNTAFFFTVPADVMQETNQIDIDIFAFAGAGIFGNPFILDADTGSFRLFALAFLTVYLPWIFFGIGMITGLMMLAVSLLSVPKVDGQILIGLECIITGILFLDYTSIEYLPVTYLRFSRILFSLRHIYFLFFLFIALAVTGRKISVFTCIFSVVQILCALLLLFYPRDIASLEKIFSYTCLSVIPLFPYLIFCYLKYRENRSGLGILLSGAFTTFISALINFFPIIFPSGGFYIARCGFSIVIFLSLIFILGIIFFQYRALAVGRRRFAIYMAEAARDNPTGVFNRKILCVLEHDLFDDFSVIFMRIDNLRSVNDMFGYAAGNKILQSIVNCIREHLRGHDYIIRVGEDEFASVLPGCGIKTSCELAALIVNCISLLKIFPDRQRQFVCTVSVGVAASSRTATGAVEKLSEIMARADAEAYKSGQAGKNRVSAAYYPLIFPSCDQSE